MTIFKFSDFALVRQINKKGDLWLYLKSFVIAHHPFEYVEVGYLSFRDGGFTKRSWPTAISYVYDFLNWWIVSKRTDLFVPGDAGVYSHRDYWEPWTLINKWIWDATAVNSFGNMSIISKRNWVSRFIDLEKMNDRFYKEEHQHHYSCSCADFDGDTMVTVPINTDYHGGFTHLLNKSAINKIYGKKVDYCIMDEWPLISKEMADAILQGDGRMNKKHCKNPIEKVIFNDPATIVFWKDGTKTVVRCQEGETYDKEKGLAMAMAKKFLGNKHDYYDIFAKWLK